MYVVFATDYPSSRDLYGKITLTFWTCGCNLLCPFCHNWKIARLLDCENVSKDKWIEFVENWIREVKNIDYIHITGGEPTIAKEQTKIISNISKKYGFKVSINSNLTTPWAGKFILNHGDHVAFDIKLPFPIMTGLPQEKVFYYAKNFANNLKLLFKNNIPFEARIPVAKEITYNALEYEGSKKIFELLEKWSENTEGIVRVIPLYHKRKGVAGFNDEFCEKYCNSDEDAKKVYEYLKENYNFNVVLG